MSHIHLHSSAILAKGPVLSPVVGDRASGQLVSSTGLQIPGTGLSYPVIFF